MKQSKRNTCMVWEHYVVVLSVNHVSEFCMRLCVSGWSHIKYTYMIDREHNHVVFSDHANLSQQSNKKFLSIQ